MICHLPIISGALYKNTDLYTILNKIRHYAQRYCVLFVETAQLLWYFAV